MDFIDGINKETIIICNNYLKQKILKEKKLKPIKFMSIEEFIDKYYFSYDEKTIMFVMKNYHVKYDVAIIYIKNLYYIENKLYGIKKLDFLVNLKKKLEENKLLIYNDNFKKYVKNVDIIVYGIRVSKFLEKMLTGLNYRIYDRSYRTNNHKVIEFSTMEEEIEYVAYSIASLIDNGIDINKIKLTNVDSSYNNTIERIFSLFGLKTSLVNKTSLSSFPIVKEFIRLYKNNALDVALEQIDKKNIIYDEIVKVINKYIKYEDKELIIYKLENSYITSDKYDNVIEIVDYFDYVSEDDEYVFMIGFNDSIIPRNVSDTDYITDNIKENLSLEDTRILNKITREDTIKVIEDIKNLTITYKLSDFKRSYYPSTLCSNFEIIKGDTNYKKSYSEIYDKVKLVKKYDDYLKYGYKSHDFDLLNSNYEINYNSFSNKFTGIDRVMNELKLSYSKMQIYNKCQFRYYLSEILKLDIFEENFGSVIGNMVHYVMEKCLSNNDMDIDKYVVEFLKDRKLSKKEQFFLEKYKDSINDLLNQVLLEKEYSLFDKAMYEKEITIELGNNIKFIGFIDKILYYEDNTGVTYVSLIDYKTGNDDINLKYLKHGINIQLPIYLYLSSNLKFENVKYVGFYLQKFNITDKDYRLVGYSNSDKDILSVIDNNYDNSKIIKGLKTNNDGSFSKNSKVLSNDEIEKIKETVHNVIINTIDNIKNNCFEINPKVSDGKNISCDFCKFKDICYMTKNNEVKIQTEEFGGDE